MNMRKNHMSRIAIGLLIDADGGVQHASPLPPATASRWSSNTGEAESRTVGGGEAANILEGGRGRPRDRSTRRADAGGAGRRGLGRRRQLKRWRAGRRAERGEGRGRPRTKRRRLPAAAFRAGPWSLQFYEAERVKRGGAFVGKTIAKSFCNSFFHFDVTNLVR